MIKQISQLRVYLVLILGVLFFCSGAFAMVDRRELNRGDNGRGNSRDHRMDRMEERHYYRDGRWYKHDSRGHEIAVDFLSNGELIESLPPQHTTIVIQGASYYHDDRYYYKQAPRGGYAVVSPPVMVQPQSQNYHDERGGKGGNGHNEERRGENH